MPIYCYQDEQGQIHDLSFPVGEAPKETTLDDGTSVKRNFAAEAKNPPPGKGWPMECYASGVHPEQAGLLQEQLKDKGVPTDVSKDGNPIYRDARHRKRALKARGMFDRASYDS